jgi:hypothetical protein
MPVFSLAIFMVWVATVIGWIMNIYATVTVLWVDGPVTVTGMLVLRVVGIFLAPLGAVLGYF